MVKGGGAGKAFRRNVMERELVMLDSIRQAGIDCGRELNRIREGISKPWRLLLRPSGEARCELERRVAARAVKP